MIILKWFEPQPSPVRRIVVIFGVGLIGQEILFALKRSYRPDEISLPFSWSIPAQQSSQINTILDTLSALAMKDEVPSTQIAVVWSAGVAGFAGNEAEFDQEHAAFLKILGLCNSLNKNASFMSVEFHFLSSAGGLYEGQRMVDYQSLAAPKRAYGRAKLRQEQALRACSDSLKVSVYRPSTVYGVHAGAGRQGLVIKLMNCLMNGQTTTIYGRPHTLRDYIMSRDVGHFIAHKVGHVTDSNFAEYILASGKPTSLMEIVLLVEEIFQKRALIRYSLDADNALDTTFRRGCRPDGWIPADLAYGIKATALQHHVSALVSA